MVSFNIIRNSLDAISFTDFVFCIFDIYFFLFKFKDRNQFGDKKMDDDVESKTVDDEEHKEFLRKCNISECNKERSLMVYRPFVFHIPETLLTDTIINGRFKIGQHLGGGFTGFVRSGKKF